ncbi:MAG TPA: T9SS type A sorting domain-containing protein [Bacteroidales bacterium]|nr:T9SS type A sorting domain-containing protein [Bacteroidales bacterium]HRZ21691.1 T9SS type A sorting domain-containing protein [Bacteroidales bacterium]
MKKFPFATLSLFLVINLNLIAQPQWKFHLAYEDATGARDTIWFIWDTSATFYGLDTALGEKIVSIDTSTFNVWTSNHSSTTYDTIKTVVLPYTYSFGQKIRACHFTLPITINWDSSLLHASWLPTEPVGWVNRARIMNDYFFWINNDPLGNYFDMTLDHQVRAPDTNITDPWFWNPQVHFPMNVLLMQDPTIGIQDINSLHEISINLSPNPVTNTLYINTEETYKETRIYDLRGETCLITSQNDKKTILDVSILLPGVYVICFISDKGYAHNKKFIKVN